MKTLRRKIIMSLAALFVGGTLILILAARIFLGNHSGEYRKFSESHTGELARVRAMMRPAAQPSVKTAVQRGSSTLSTGPAEVGRVAKVSADTLREESYRLSEAEWENIKIDAAWEFSLVLPAVGGAGAPLQLDEPLRRQIREEMLYRGLGRVNLFTQETSATRSWVNGTASLTSRTEVLLEHTEAFMNGGDWGVPDFKDYRVISSLSLLNARLPMPAVLRLERGGNATRATSLAEHYLDYLGACRVCYFPYAVLLNQVRQWVLCASPGAPGEATLARIDAALRRGRWDARQMADVRASHVMRLREMFRLEDNPHPVGKETRLQWMVDTMGKRGLAAVYSAALRPVALAWNAGTADDVYKSLPMAISKISRFWNDGVIVFPPELAAREGDPPVNLELDLTRLAVAAARYRRAEGHIPNQMDDLIPRYLEPEWRGQGRSCWIIEEAAGGTYPDLRAADNRFRVAVDGYFVKNATLPRDAGALRPWAADETELKRFEKFFHRVEAFPVFYQARRVTLPRSCAPAVANDENWFLRGCLYDNYMDFNSNGASPGSPTERALLRRLREGRSDTEVWVVRGFAPVN